MANESKDGGPAFPADPNWTHPQTVDEAKRYATGMSLRDYFAAKAMHAAAVYPAGADGFTFHERAVWAYEQADAMLRVREGGGHG